MVSLVKNANFIGQVPVINRLPGGEGESIGEARVEKLKSGALVFHINLSGKGLEDLRRGFSLGDLSIAEEEKDE